MNQQSGAENWWARGTVERMPVAGVERDVFVRVAGSGPTLTLLHGYPASSLEWAGLWDAFTGRCRTLAVDFLGFGRSDKPHRHRYRLDEQAELVRHVWQSHNVERTTIVAYDYGAIIAQLLLTDRAARDRVERVIFLNGGMYPELYRPRRIQTLALNPVLGPLLWKTTSERTFARSWTAIFGPEHKPAAELVHQHWLAASHGDPGTEALRRLLFYIPDRAARAATLTATLTGPTPLSFLWGCADPVAGAPIARALRQRIPDIDLVEYPDLGHCPHLEAPDRVGPDILARLPQPGA
ncbi:MAG TPA: alpha/beta hydrolase [Pseudonocardiaceae bacterium]